ncbi:MAG: hypothetical protein HY255_09990 [Betaproteobacteria bacterium]|nr:hypothetical protein [Betaproteobacteria bacterium]
MTHASMLKNRRAKQKAKKHAVTAAKQAMELKMQAAKPAAVAKVKKASTK